MLSIAVGPHHSSCCCTRPRRLLPDPSTVANTRTQPRQPVKLSSVVSLHQRTKPLVVSSSLGSPTQLNWTVTHRHILALNLIASAAFLSTAWLFFSAIPALLALREACRSLESRLDVAREQLPDAMAAVRLSGMEISDLTMELSDLGQEITHKVKSTTRVARVAEEKLRQFASLSATGGEATVQTVNDTTDYPPLAKSVRGMKEGLVKSRSSLQMFISFTYYFKLIRNFYTARAQDKTR